MGVNLLMIDENPITPHMQLVKGMGADFPYDKCVSVRLVQVRVVE